MFNLSRGLWVVSESAKVNCFDPRMMQYATIFTLGLHPSLPPLFLCWKLLAEKIQLISISGTSCALTLYIFGWQLKHSSKRGAAVNKSTKQDSGKDDGKSGKVVGRTSTAEKELIYLESRQSGLNKALSSTAANGSITTGSSKGLISPTKSLDVHGSKCKLDGLVRYSDVNF